MQKSTDAATPALQVEATYVNNLVNLAARDGVQLNQQFVQDVNTLNSQLTSYGFPNPSFDAAGTSGGGGGVANSVGDAATGAVKANHTPGTLDSLANGAVADGLRSWGDQFRAGTDLLLAPVDGAFQAAKGAIGSEVKGIEDFAHGDIIGGIGHTVGAPLIGAFDGLKGVGHELWDGVKNEWHSLENSFNAITHIARAGGDVVRTAFDVAATPVAAAVDTVTGTVGSVVKGAEDLAHGDIVGGVAHIVGAPVEGVVHGVEGAAHEVGNAAKNVWHAIENLF